MIGPILILAILRRGTFFYASSRPHRIAGIHLALALLTSGESSYVEPLRHFLCGEHTDGVILTQQPKKGFVGQIPGLEDPALLESFAEKKFLHLKQQAGFFLEQVNQLLWRKGNRLLGLTFRLGMRFLDRLGTAINRRLLSGQSRDGGEECEGSS